MRQKRKRQETLRRKENIAKLVALNILCMSCGNTAVALCFLQRELEQANPCGVRSSYEEVVATYEGMPEEERSDLREPTAFAEPSPVSRKAMAFLKENKLAEWIKTRNLEQGIAPVTAVVAEQAVINECIMTTSTMMKYKSQKQWLRRWRKRWNITLANIPAREHVPVHEAQNKVVHPIRKMRASFHTPDLQRHDFQIDLPPNGFHYVGPISGPRAQNKRKAVPSGGTFFFN